MIDDLPKLAAHFDMTFDLGHIDAIATTEAKPDPVAFHLRSELVRLSLFEGFR